MNRYADARNAANQAREDARSSQQKEEVRQFLAFLHAAQNNAGNDLSPGQEDDESDAPAARGPQEAQETTPSQAQDASKLQEATGVVTDLSCMNGLKMKVETAAGSLTLALTPGTQLRFRLTSKPSGPFNPCSALKGQRVSVEYEPEGAGGTTGSLKSVTVLGGADAVAGGAPELPGARRLGARTTGRETVTTSAEGAVEQVSCAGNEMLLKLDADEALFTLHARDSTRVPVEQDVAFDAGDFKICSQLQGHSAKITFIVVDGKTYDGEIQSVEVLK
jgi:hypothetical protein